MVKAGKSASFELLYSILCFFWQSGYSLIEDSRVNLFLLNSADSQWLCYKDDPRYDHLRRVLRVRKGDKVCIGAVRGPRGTGEVFQIDAEKVVIHCDWEESTAATRASNLSLYFPYCRPHTAKRLVQEASTLGVGQIVVFESQKGEVSYRNSTFWKQESIRSILVKGAEQGFHTQLPIFEQMGDLKSTLDGLNGGISFALDNYQSQTPLVDQLITLSNPNMPIRVFIGGERGWSDTERELFEKARIRLAHLGPEVLKMELAASVAIGLIREICFRSEEPTPSYRQIPD